eukprot:526282-Pyramimonas_sp.AAC.1
MSAGPACPRWSTARCARRSAPFLRARFLGRAASHLGAWILFSGQALGRIARMFMRFEKWLSWPPGR